MHRKYSKKVFWGYPPEQLAKTGQKLLCWKDTPYAVKLTLSAFERVEGRAKDFGYKR